MILYTKFYTRKQIQQNPNMIFVFGDNVLRKGNGGQAFATRGEPNTLGIITKRLPTYDEDAFWSDELFDEWWSHSIADFALLQKYIKNDVKLVFPIDGLGTGLAKLEESSPKIWKTMHITLNKVCGQVIYFDEKDL